MMDLVLKQVGEHEMHALGMLVVVDVPPLRHLAEPSRREGGAIREESTIRLLLREGQLRQRRVFHGPVANSARPLTLEAVEIPRVDRQDVTDGRVDRSEERTALA